MNIQKIHLVFASVIILLFVFFRVFFNKYEYKDYIVKSCESGKIYFDAKLIGSFSDDSPLVRGNPYYFRLEIKNFDNKEFHNVQLDSLYLDAVNTPEKFPLDLSKELINGSKIFLAENIDIPYQEYILRGTFFLKNGTGRETKVTLKCNVERAPSSEYRITLIDNLLSV